METKHHQKDTVEIEYDLWDEAVVLAGSYGDVANLNLSGKPISPPKSTIEILLEGRPSLRTPEEISPILEDLLAKIHFSPQHHIREAVSDWVGLIEQNLAENVGLLVKKVNQKTGITILENYPDRLKRASLGGKRSAATAGTGLIGEHPCAVYALHYDFMQGTPGALEGRLYQEITDYAIRHKLPFIGIYSSGGIRQHENLGGLSQMTRIANAVKNFRERSTQPNLAVLIGQDWGGIPASAVGLADYIIALWGTDHGFTGRRVIKTFTGIDVPNGLQSAEAHSLYRTIEKLVPNQDAAIEYISDVLDILDRSGGERLKLSHLRDHKIVDRVNGRKFYFGFNGFRFNPDEKLTESNLSPAIISTSSASELYNRYMMLAKDANRPDMEFFMKHIFSNWVRIYDPYNVEDLAHNPAIAGGFGRIGPQPFLILGNLPTYQNTSEGIKKIPSSPAPCDFRYLQRMLEMVGERYQLPAVFFTDTLGASPTIEAEKQDQAREIAKSIYHSISYKHPLITCVIGALGSGGGLATAPLADWVIALQQSMLFVAEPGSMASILYSKDHPELTEVVLTVDTIGATAEDQLQLKLIDRVIPEPMKNGVIDYLYVARRLRLEITKGIIPLLKLSERRLMDRRDKRIRLLEGLR